MLISMFVKIHFLNTDPLKNADRTQLSQWQKLLNEMGYPVYYGDPKKNQEWWFLMIFKVIQTMGRAFHLSMAKSMIFYTEEN